MESLAALLERIRACTLCAEHLPHGPRPVVRAATSARILIAGQAPGRRVHASGVPFDDPSGDRLRDWMAVTREEFYDSSRIALVPMGFCYPGTGNGGDLPPRPECAPAWRAELLARLRRVELTLVIGSYAHAYHLGVRRSSVPRRCRAGALTRQLSCPCRTPVRATCSGCAATRGSKRNSCPCCARACAKRWRAEERTQPRNVSR